MLEAFSPLQKKKPILLKKTVGGEGVLWLCEGWKKVGNSSFAG